MLALASLVALAAPGPVAHTLVVVDASIAEDRRYIETLVRSTGRFRVVEPLACDTARVSAECVADDRCLSHHATACGVEVVVVWERVDRGHRGLRVLRDSPPFGRKVLVDAGMEAWAPALDEALLGPVQFAVDLGVPGGISADGLSVASDGPPVMVTAVAGKIELSAWARGHVADTQHHIVLPGEDPRLVVRLAPKPRPVLPIAPLVGLGIGLLGGVAAGVALGASAAAH